MERTIELIPGLPREEVTKRCFLHQRDTDASRRALAFYLYDMDRRGLQGPGFRNAAHWAFARLQISENQARRLISVARHLEELPLVDQAFAHGELSWTKVRSIAPIAVPETEVDWLSFAKKHNVRKVEEEVRKVGERGKKPGERLRSERTTYWIRICVPEGTYHLFEKTLEKLRRVHGRSAKTALLLRVLCELVLGMDFEGEEAAAAEGRTRSPCKVLLHVSQETGEAWIDTPEGRESVSRAFVEEEIARGAETEVVKDVALRGELEAIPFGKRGSVPKEERDRELTPEERLRIFERDGWRCLLCEREVTEETGHAHHGESHADGGKSSEERCFTLCESCHGGVHEGSLRVRIEENGDVTRLSRDGAPLDEQVSPREILGGCEDDASLTVIEKAPPATGETAPEDSQLHSFDDLPAEVSAAEWRALESSLDWNSARRAYVARPEADGLFDLAPQPKAPAQKAPGLPSSTASRRPESLDDFVGAAGTIATLLLALGAAQKRGETLGHVLLSGPPGLGKTSLARIIAREMDRPLRTALGGLLGDPHLVVSLLSGLSHSDVLFIDEIHALPSKCQESLYTALEDGFVDVVIAEGARTRPLRIRLEPFTLLGATTELQLLSEPFRARFALHETLRTLEPEEVVQVLERKGATGILIERDAAEAIACRSRGVPREALRLLDRARDLADISEAESITLAHVEEVAEMLGIDREGFTAADRLVLKHLLAREGAIGIESIAAATGIAEGTLRSVVEPYLIRKGFLVRTPTGRVATSAARAWRDRSLPRGAPISWN